MDSIVISNIRQRPLRSAISAVGVALGVALVMLFTGLARGLSNELQRRSSNVRAEIIFTRPGSLELTTSASNLSTKYVDLLKQIEGVESATPVILYFYQTSDGFGLEQVEGVEWNDFARMNGITMVEGRAPQAINEVVVDETKEKKHHPIGSALKLFGDKPYNVVGVYRPESGARVKLSLEGMQSALEVPGKCTYILVKCKNPDEQVAIARLIDQKIPGNKVQFTRDVFTSPEKNIPSLGIFLRVLVGLAAVVSALVVMLAMYTTITERTREIGILKAMGASRSYIIGEIEREALLISAMGLVIGFAFAGGVGVFIEKAYGLFFEFGGLWALTAGAIGLAGGAVGALYPAVRAANLDPVEALMHE
jgi:putative ABC transport system permease protein